MMPSTSHTDLVAHIVHTADGRLASMTEIERRSELTREQIRGATRSLIDQGYLLRTDDDPDTGEAVFTTLGATADVGARVDPNLGGPRPRRVRPRPTAAVNAPPGTTTRQCEYQPLPPQLTNREDPSHGLVACTYASDGLLVGLRSDGSTLTTVEAGSDSGTRSATDMVNDSWDQARNAHVAAH